MSGQPGGSVRATTHHRPYRNSKQPPHLGEDMMEGQAMFLVCPAYLDTDGTGRCGLPAEVEARYTMRSTGGPLECAKIRCRRGHGFNGPIEFLTIQEEPAAASVTSASTNNVLAETALDE